MKYNCLLLILIINVLKLRKFEVFSIKQYSFNRGSNRFNRESFSPFSANSYLVSQKIISGINKFKSF